MILFTNIKSTQRYFWLGFLISLLLIMLTPIGIRNYFPIVFGFPTFILFALNANGYWHKFSKELKIKEPEIFKKNELYYGYHKGELIMLTNIFDDTEFAKIEEEQLLKMYQDLKKYNLLILYSFFAFIFLSIFLIQTKPIV